MFFHMLYTSFNNLLTFYPQPVDKTYVRSHFIGHSVDYSHLYQQTWISETKKSLNEYFVQALYLKILDIKSRMSVHIHASPFSLFIQNRPGGGNHGSIVRTKR